jgi:hypothetical protein
MEHVHVEPPEALIEVPEHWTVKPDRAERRLELASVLLLALATLATAWCGYQAAMWSGEQSELYAEATSTRTQAAQAHTQAGQQRIDDLLYFDAWLDARQVGNERLAAIQRRRFRPEFVPAFEAWIAQRPFTNPDAIAGPLYMPEYRSAELERSKELHAEADGQFEEGTHAKHHAHSYVLTTVFMAAVLFFAGISLRLEWRPLRIVVMGMAVTMLVVGSALALALPLA